MTQRIPLPEPVAKIYEAVEELQNLYPGRKFIPDGHLDLRHADQCRLGRRVDCAQLLAERGAGGDVDDTPEPGGLLKTTFGASGTANASGLSRCSRLRGLMRRFSSRSR